MVAAISNNLARSYLTTLTTEAGLRSKPRVVCGLTLECLHLQHIIVNYFLSKYDNIKTFIEEVELQGFKIDFLCVKGSFYNLDCFLWKLWSRLWNWEKMLQVNGEMENLFLLFLGNRLLNYCSQCSE